MKTSRLLILSVIMLSLMACQLISNLINNPGAPGVPGGGSGIFSEPANPIDVVLTLEDTVVSQVIPVGGGSLSASGADGTQYTLTIPPGALLVDTEISMTPVAAMDGLPFAGGMGGAVKLEPSGLTFDEFVTLKIQPANPIPLENQVFFGFEEDGQDLHLALPVVDSSEIEILMLHFSGAGVANGTSDEKAAVYKRMADRVEARLTNEMSNYLQDLRNGAEPDPARLEAIFQEYYNSVVLSRLKAASAASGTCADAKQALQTYLGWARQYSLLGGEEQVAKAKNVVAEFGPVAAKKCFDEEFKRCAVQHEVAGMIPMLLSFERMGQLLGALDTADPANEEKAWADARTYGYELANRCFQWELVFDSVGNFTAEEGGYESRVQARIPIRVQGGAQNLLNLVIKGSAPLNNTHFEFFDSYDDCDVFSTPGGGEFMVDFLGWEPELRKDSDGEMRFFVKDFLLKYYPGNTSESIGMECWDSEGKRYPRMDTSPAPLWTGTFIMNHYKETVSGQMGQTPPPVSLDDLFGGGSPDMGTSESFLAKDWRVTPAKTMGTKNWEGNSDLDGSVFEGGEFQLIHTPQQ